MNPLLPSASRRHFLKAATVVAATLPVESNLIRAAKEESPTLVDTNIALGQWPFRREPIPDTASLVAKLREHQVAEAWAGSYEALLHKDITSVNARLAEECARHPGWLVPIGALNPKLPGWEEDLRRIAEVHHMPGLRLHPNYHGYSLDDPVFERVLRLARERELLVQIAVILEEERTIHPLVNVPATQLAPLSAVLAKVPGVRLQLLNAFRTLRGLTALSLASLGVSFEIAMLEGVNGVATLLETLPGDRLCFGSHAPFFYFESAKLKLRESILSEAQLAAVSRDNAARLIARR